MSPDKAGDTKNKIIIAASMLFAKHGFEGTSMRQISKDAEVSLASINYHFKSKKELYVEILTSSRNALGLLFDEKLRDETDFFVCVQSYFTVCLENADMMRNVYAMFTSPLVLPADTVDSISEAFCTPPGFNVIQDRLKTSLGGDKPADILYWASINMIKYIMSWVIWTNPESLSGAFHKKFGIGENEIRKMIDAHCKAVYNHVNSETNFPEFIVLSQLAES